MGIAKVNVKEVFYAYENKKDVLKEIDFSLQSGKILSILSPNGCGKTTLLKCINGILHLRSGSILLDNKDISIYRVHELAKKIAYIPQFHNPIFPYKVIDMVLMGRNPYIPLYSFPRKNDIAITYQSLRELGIEYLAEKKYSELSGGERQLIFFARILAQQAELLLLDEPASHLDLSNQIKILDMIKQLSNFGITIIMSTHIPDQALMISDNCILMKEGQLYVYGDPEIVINTRNIEQVFGVSSMIIDSPYPANRKICVPISSII